MVEAVGIDLIVTMIGVLLATLAMYWNVYKSLADLYGECRELKRASEQCEWHKNYSTLLCMSCDEIGGEISHASRSAAFGLGVAVTLIMTGVIFGEILASIIYALLSVVFVIAILWRSVASISDYRAKLSTARAELNQCVQQGRRE